MPVNCDPAALLAAAKCFDCLTPKQREQVITMSLCQIAAGTGFFVSPLALQGTLAAAYNHRLGGTPRNVRGVLVCLTDDANTGYVVGDEVNIDVCFSIVGTTNSLTVWANATQVGYASSVFANAQEAEWQMQRKDGVAAAQPSLMANWAIKIYAWL